MSYLKLNESLSSRINSSRLLNEAEALNSKVNQYRKTLSFGFSTSKNDSLCSSSVRRTGPATSNPKREYSSLRSISKAFAPMPSADRLNISHPQPANLKHLYNDQIKTLYSNFKSSLTKIEELYSDNNKSEASLSLLKKILNDDIFLERETQISNLIEEIAELKGGTQHKAQNNGLIQRQIDSLKEINEREIQKATNESNRIIEKMKKDASELNSLNHEYQEELLFIKADHEECKSEKERLQNVISELEKDYHQTRSQLKERGDQYDSLKRNYENIQEQLYDSSLKAKQYDGVIDQYENDIKSTNERCSLYQLDSQNDLLISYENQHQSKFDSFDVAIANLKESNGKLEAELKCEREKVRLGKQSYNKLYQEMQEKVKLLSTEWEKKHKEEQRGYETLIAEIDYKSKEQIREMMNENDAVIGDKDREIAQCKENIEVLQAIQRDSIRISQHEEKVNEELNILNHKHYREKVFVEEEHKIKLSDLEKEKKSEYEAALDEVNSLLKQAEREKEEMKEKYEQLKAQLNNAKESNETCNKEISELNATIEEKLKEITELSNTIQLKQKEISANDSAIKDKAQEIAMLTEQNVFSKETLIKANDELEDKIKQIAELETDKAKGRTINLNLKNEIQGLVLSIRDLESKIKSNAETNSLLSNQLTDSIFIRDKLIESLHQIKAELNSMKQFDLQLIQNAKNDIWNIAEGLNSKLQHYDTKKWNQMKDLEEQFAKHFTEQYSQNEKLKHENKDLIDLHQEDLYKINDLVNQLSDKDSEITKMQSALLKTEEEVSQTRDELGKLQAKEKEAQKKMKGLIEELSGKAVRMKKLYQSKLSDLRASIEHLKQTHISEVAQASKTQNASLQNVIKTLKSESVVKADSLQKLKTLNQTLTIDSESKGDQLANTKKEYDKLIAMKDKKIKSLQNIISQSFNTYSNGINSLKTSQKLNDEVRNLIRRAKEEEEALSIINSKD